MCFTLLSALYSSVYRHVTMVEEPYFCLLLEVKSQKVLILIITTVGLSLCSGMAMHCLMGDIAYTCQGSLPIYGESHSQSATRVPARRIPNTRIRVFGIRCYEKCCAMRWSRFERKNGLGLDDFRRQGPFLRSVFRMLFHRP